MAGEEEAGDEEAVDLSLDGSCMNASMFAWMTTAVPRKFDVADSARLLTRRENGGLVMVWTFSFGLQSLQTSRFVSGAQLRASSDPRRHLKLMMDGVRRQLEGVQLAPPEVEI